MKKRFDLAVKTGEYIQAGQTKSRYENIGVIVEGNDGMFILLRRTFNPAGVPNPKGDDKVVVSMLEPREKESTERAPSTTRGQMDTGGMGSMLADVPFNKLPSTYAI